MASIQRVFFWALLVLLGDCGVSASPSQACGVFTRTCQLEASGFYVTTYLSLNAFAFPNGSYPIVNPTGSVGELLANYVVYAPIDTACASPILNITRVGQWMDDGNAGSQGLERKLVFDGTQTTITPLTASVVTNLVTKCSCLDYTQWALNTPRTITVCPGPIDCTLDWISMSSPGVPQYGIAKVFPPGQLSLSIFNTSEASYENLATNITFNRQSPCTILSPSGQSVCGDYKGTCRASQDGKYNVKEFYSFVGDDVGIFVKNYALYQPNDVTCTQTQSASFTFTGSFALQGPGNCDEDCVGAEQMEMFVTYSTFVANTPELVTYLNSVCSCGGTWQPGIPRKIMSCPLSNCTVYPEDFSHGLPAGLTLAGYGNYILTTSDQLSITELNAASTSAPNYGNAFTYSDYLLRYTGDSECAQAKNNSILCGTYRSECVALSSTLSNAVVSIEFYGWGSIGTFTKTFRRYLGTDTTCSGAVQVEYVLTGSYAVHNQSTCGDVCIYGTSYQIEMMLTRAAITPYTPQGTATLEGNCFCNNVTWTQGQTTIITGCESCQLAQFQGFDGLNVGMVFPVYGNLARFADRIALTYLDSDAPTGYGSAFSATSIIMYRNPSESTCVSAPIRSAICGVYNDGCRASKYEELGFDYSNAVRNWTFYGDNYGEFVYNHSVHVWTDVNCADTSLSAFISITGTFVIHGPSDCGGLCPGDNALAMELSVGATTILPINGDFRQYLETSCDCGGEWKIAQARTLANCPMSSCSIQLHGLPVGSSSPVYANIVRFGGQVVISDASDNGYGVGFTANNQPLTTDFADSNTVCQSSPYLGLCGVFQTTCQGSYEDTTAVNTIESLYLSGGSSGTFVRTFVAYSTASALRCSSQVLRLESWNIEGTYAMLGPSTCGGSCIGGNATVMNVTTATVSSLLKDTLGTLNFLCACDGVWESNTPRTISNCQGDCDLSSLPGAHGLFVGTSRPAYGTVYVSNTRLALTNFAATTDGFNTPFNAQNDHVYFLQADQSSNKCTAKPTPPPPAPIPGYSNGGDSGLSAGGGIMIAFTCIVAVYIIGGMVYNYRAGATGVDMLPHLSFWKSVPGLVKDGFVFSWTFVTTCGKGTAATGSYQAL